MARNKAFDEDIVLSQMMELFWRQGYEATSMRHIEVATNLSPSSLYNAFGSKQNLFNRTLQFYIDNVIGKRVKLYLQSHEPALVGVREFIVSTFKAVPLGYDRQSCLLVNTAAELGQTEKALGLTILNGLKKVDKAIIAALLRAKLNGELVAHADCQMLGKQLSLMLPGLLISAKNNANTDDLEKVLDAFWAHTISVHQTSKAK